jgi:hypothetical protein
MKKLKYLQTFESFVNEAFDLNMYFKTQKIIADIQDVAKTFVDEQTSSAELPRDIATKKDNLILWVAKTYKKELIDKNKDEKFIAYLKGDVEKINQSFKAKIEETFEREYENGYAMIFDYFLSLSRKNKLNIVTSTYTEMYDEQQNWHDNLDVINVDVTDESGEVLMSFPDGYYWIDLLTNNSPQEAAAMGHCGRTSANTILSLRDSNKKSHVTIAVDYLVKSEFTFKSIRQCKGKQNTKPVPRYHKYIVDLLLDDRFETVITDKQEYRASSDFHIFDIQDERLLIKLLSNREQLFRRLPLIFFEKNNNIEIILETFPDILKNPSALDYIYLKLHGRIDNDAEYEGFETHNSKTYYIEGNIINIIDYEKLEKDLERNKNITTTEQIKQYLKEVRVCDLAPSFVSKLIEKDKGDVLKTRVLEDKIFLYKHGFISEISSSYDVLELDGDFYKIEEMDYTDVQIHKFYELVSGYKWTIIERDEYENYPMEALIENFSDFLETDDPEDAEYLHEIGMVDDKRLKDVEKAYQSFITDYPQRYALFQWLVDEGNIDDIKGSLYAVEETDYDAEYSNEYSHPDDSVGGEYYVLDDDKATEKAIEYTKETLYDCGISDYLISKFVDNDALLDYIRTEYEFSVNDDPENYDVDKEFTGEEALAEAQEKLEEAETRLEKYQQILKEKEDVFDNLDDDSDNYEDLETEISEIEAEIENIETEIENIETEIENIEDESGDYYEITEDTIESKINELVAKYSYNPITWLEDIYGKGDEVTDFLQKQGWIDIVEMAEWCVEQDGRGHVLNSYDGNEHRVVINVNGKDVTYYIYRNQ